ncbi:MAG TPA: hypothetical protein VML19_16690 [Verrucomicrobiae bacterium]|nr:hypothetical protein [Verrucomicrobiae bacterium]
MRMLKILGWGSGLVAVLYAISTGALYALMIQPPETFGAGMAKVPMVAMMVLPFEPLWMHARKGALDAGDAAPDFSLPTLDRTRTVRLSEEARQRPVVLIFGSYT